MQSMKFLTPTLAACLATALTFAACQNSALSPNPSATAARTPTADLPWDWSGIIGTGQSLAVGQAGKPIASTTQPFHNLKLSTAQLPWPIDPANPTLSLVPLVEPIGRPSTSYPSAWPTNIAGETPHAAMANQLSALAQAQLDRDFISIHSEVGENGQCLRFLQKNATPSGVNGRSFQAAIIETTAIARLAKSAGKTFGVGAVIITHGECDAGNTRYEADLHQLWQDFNTDIKAITGQTKNLQLIVSQQNAVNNRSIATQAQWKIGADFPADIVCSGPKYQYMYANDGVHLITDGYRALGEKYAQVYFERVVLNKNWQPLQPTAIDRTGLTITIHFHVPVPPLAWDSSLEPPHAAIPEWKDAKGFEVATAADKRIPITSAEITGDAVTLTCAADPGPNARVSYAMISDKKMTKPFPGTIHWGLLRDSDPFQGAVTHKPQPNFAVAFELPAP